MKQSSRKKACSTGFEEVQYAVGSWVPGSVEAAITEEAMDPSFLLFFTLQSVIRDWSIPVRKLDQQPKGFEYLFSPCQFSVL